MRDAIAATDPSAGFDFGWILILIVVICGGLYFWWDSTRPDACHEDEEYEGKSENPEDRVRKNQS